MTKRKGDIKNMITASEVAKIWNERAQSEGRETNYTRYSVYPLRDELGYTETPLGFLYEKSRAETSRMPQSRKRPDVAARNQELYKGHKRNKETGQFEPTPETEG
jgi:hypothetical protein